MRTIKKEAEARAAIIAAAAHLFKQYGIHKTTMEEISLSMGKSNKYAYYYFKNKEEIFSEFGRQELARMLADISRLVNKENTLEGKIKSLFHARLHCVHNSIASYPMPLSEIGINMPAITGMIEALSANFAGELESLLKKLAASRKAQRRPGDCHAIATTYSDLMTSIDIRFAVLGTTVPDSRLQVLIDNLMRGI